MNAGPGPETASSSDATVLRLRIVSLCGDAAVAGAGRAQQVYAVWQVADDDFRMVGVQRRVVGLRVAGLEQQVVGQRRRPLALEDVLGRLPLTDGRLGETVGDRLRWPRTLFVQSNSVVRRFLLLA